MFISCYGDFPLVSMIRHAIFSTLIEYITRGASKRQKDMKRHEKAQKDLERHEKTQKDLERHEKTQKDTLKDSY